jgi:hypothetical protein
MNSFSGKCRCGHRFEEHHNAIRFSAADAEALSLGDRPYFAEECEHDGCNEEGGLAA